MNKFYIIVYNIVYNIVYMKKILVFLIILFVLVYINIYTDGWLLTITNNMPKFIALAVGILALMFPHDYDKVPDIIYNIYQGNNFVNKKRRVSESTKKYIASMQKWICNNCSKLLDASYEIDHKIPLYKGGNNNIKNLQALCRNCHGMKTINDKINL